MNGSLDDQSFADLVRRTTASIRPPGGPVEADLSFEAFTRRGAWSERSAAQRRSGSGKTARLGRQTLRGKATYIIAPLAAAVVVIGVANRRERTGDRMRPLQTYTTLSGQAATIGLPDGSRVQLGPATTFSILTDLAGRRLEARLSGEAIFAVKHHPNVAFFVQTGNAITRVLGTQFLVRRYPTEQVTRVIVADGRVAVSSIYNPTRSPAVVLPARALGTVDDSGHVSVTPNIAVDDYTAWTTGQLIFRNTPIPDVLAELSRAYDVELHLVDSAFAERHLTGTILFAQKSLAEVLEMLSNVLDAHPVRSGRVITFVPGRAAAPHSSHSPLSSASERQYGK